MCDMSGAAAVTHFIIGQTTFLSACASVALSFHNDHLRQGRWKPGSQIVESSTNEELVTIYAVHKTQLLS